MKKAMLFIASMLFAVSANAASVNFYNNLADFQASFVSGSLEEFEDATLNAGLTITSNTGDFSIAGGVMNERVVRNTADMVMFEFGSSVNAFGADFDLGVAGFGQGLTFTYQLFLGATEVLAQEMTGNGFFGFITEPSTLFNKVIITAGTQPGSAETFKLDNLRYGLHNPAAVPVPAALFLFAPALLGFLGLRRKGAKA